MASRYQNLSSSPGARFKAAVALAAVACIMAFFTQPAKAHVLESNNGIGAVIHIDPDDDPIAGENSSFYFEFKDTNNKLSLADCDCNVTIKQGGSVIGTEKIRAVRQLSGMIDFTLPQKAAYTLDISGKPMQSGSFASFQFSYSFRVTRGEDVPSAAANGARQEQGSNLFLSVGLALSGMLILGLVSTIVYNVKYKKRTRS